LLYQVVFHLISTFFSYTAFDQGTFHGEVALKVAFHFVSILVFTDSFEFEGIFLINLFKLSNCLLFKTLLQASFNFLTFFKGFKAPFPVSTSIFFAHSTKYLSHIILHTAIHHTATTASTAVSHHSQLLSVLTTGLFETYEYELNFCGSVNHLIALSLLPTSQNTLS
jgi:hypothetical protein